MTRKKKGQSTLEYIILVTGVTALMVAILTTSGGFNQAINATIEGTAAGMGNMVNRLRASRQ